MCSRIPLQSMQAIPNAVLLLAGFLSGRLLTGSFRLFHTRYPHGEQQAECDECSTDGQADILDVMQQEKDEF